MVALGLTRILLVHGALVDGSAWSRIIPTLQAAGYAVTAVQQPLSSISNDIAVVKSALATLNQASSAPIVVVGHSFGGTVITDAAVDQPNVHSLVYVQAFAPDQNETAASLIARYPQPESNTKLVPTADNRLVLPQSDFVKYFAHDLPKRQARIYAAAQGPFDAARFGFASGIPAWKTVKNLYYIVGTGDRIINPDLEKFMAKRIGAKTTVLDGASHIGLVSQADKVAGVILRAAHMACHNDSS